MKSKWLGVVWGIIIAGMFPSQAIAENNLKLVHFSSNNCRPCQGAWEIVQKVAGEYALPAVKYDIHNRADLAKKYQVGGTPTTVLTNNNQYVNKIEGVTDEAGLKSFLNRSLGMKPIGKTEEATNQQMTGADETEKQSSATNKTSSAVATGIAVLGIGGTALALKNKFGRPKLVPSPIDGKLVNPKQAQHEQTMLDQGYVYNPASQGFEYKPEKVENLKTKPSMLSQEIEHEKQLRHAKHQAETRKRQQARRKQDIKLDMEYEQRSYQRHMARAKEMETLGKVAEGVEITADVAVDSLAKMTGPAGEAVKEAYDLAKDGVTLASEGLVEGTKSILAGKVRGKIVKKIKPLKKAVTTAGKVTEAAQDKVLDESIKRATEKL